MIYLVGTPIGNLEDITFRAVRILEECDVVACESKERALKLLAHLGIKKPLVYLREASRETDARHIISLDAEGKTIAVITDAGMPGISDPGAYLVKQLSKAGVPYGVIPGPSAVDVAVAMSGLDEPWAFLGFLPLKEGKRRKLLERFLPLNIGLIIFEGPHRVEKLLTLLAHMCPQRKVALMRELTKVYEQVVVGFPQDISLDTYKGEFVFVIYPEEQ
ncbi:16S rRNA (cytidine(1402)-2'-O)-methyltransferase [Coprothermobacter platensis]|uniref:16S rRNA (cytidine(1402)-2'-O)-methyltransferase n=1 Tax=Coprothermobacter platensis TaxID=108819 RepID=UPI00038064E8|nr:16S rRNA (cytidine(1402)-2'-O)-methyltransferase [Coprothermobacter platensis]